MAECDAPTTATVALVLEGMALQSALGLSARSKSSSDGSLPTETGREATVGTEPVQ